MSTAQPPSTADLILVGAAIRTLDKERPSATALAVAGGQIIAVGDDTLGTELRGPGTEVIDLHGAAVVPGLVDSHMHPVMGLSTIEGVDLSTCADLAAVRDRLAAAAADLAPGGWLTGWGLDPNAFGGTAIGHAALSGVLDGRPAMLTLFDGHSAVVTPEALEQAGIRGPMTFGSRSTIVCDDAGVPTGHVLEAGALALVDAVLPAAPLAERAAGLGRLLDEMAATGLTGGHVMDLSGDAIDLYRWLDERGRLPMRLRLAPWCAPEDDRDRWAEIVAMQSLAGSLWSVDGVKLFMDGTIDGGTAWLHAPDCHGESTAAYWLDPGDYSAAVRFFAAAGVPTATHAIGDAAVHHVLDTIESDDHRDRGTRHRVEHIETLRDDQVGRFVRLGVVASMQPTHATDYTLADLSDNWSNRLGEERARRGWRSRDIAATGAVLALGSDWPIAPYDPRWVMRSARDRRSVPHPEAAPVRPEQALTAEQALAGFTTAPAYAASHESVAGRVRVGYRADLSVFTQDPVRTGPADLPDLPVVLTVVDGRVRHRSPEV